MIFSYSLSMSAGLQTPEVIQHWKGGSLGMLWVMQTYTFTDIEGMKTYTTLTASHATW